jgi:hypothetical protein
MDELGGFNESPDGSGNRIGGDGAFWLMWTLPKRVHISQSGHRLKRKQRLAGTYLGVCSYWRLICECRAGD